MSLACVVMSVVALFAASATTIAPSHGVESTRREMELVVTAFLVAWLGVAFWSRPRKRTSPAPGIQPWANRLLMVIGIVYLVGVLLLALG